MGCFRGSRKSKPEQKRFHRNNNNFVAASPVEKPDDRTLILIPPPSDGASINGGQEARNIEGGRKEMDGEGSGILNSKAKIFSLEEVSDATGNFRPQSYLGEGGFGKVYKGYLAKVDQEVAIKRLDQDGLQGAREFLAEVQTLSSADHPNLVKLIGYCVDEDQRLLVYEYMLLGSLDRHLFDLTSDRPVLDWYTRLRIAAGAARGLEYLHIKMTPPTIYRDLKCSNILLGEGYHPKLSDFGLAKVGPSGDNTHVSTRVMGTYGYCAPEYAMTGQLTFKSDARPLFKDKNNFSQLADPKLQGQFPKKRWVRALALAAMCIHEEPTSRPAIEEVVDALEYLAKLSSTRRASPQ